MCSTTLMSWEMNRNDKPHLLLQPHQQVDHRGLDGHVQRRYRLVGDDQVRVHRQRPGDGEALALAAGELVG
jgi:hypothetical protein